jgi:hypothetical protein
MGIPQANSRDLAFAESDVTLATGGDATAGVAVQGAFNLAVYGTFSGSIVAEKSFDAGTTYIAALDQAGIAITFSAAGARALFEPEAGMLWRLRAATLSSGTPGARVSQ